MADDTITVNMMPSCGSCKSQSDYAGYKKYTKTWKNLCTSTTCHSKTPGTLQVNPKGTVEGELTCSKCDSDYCGFCGTEKSGSARFKLIAGDASTSTDTSSGGDSSTSNYWDMILDLIGPLDGEVECRVENDKVYINKIPDPEDSELWIKEGVNLTSESITVHDYNPDTYNTFHITWTGGTIVLKNDYLIERFGEKLLEKQATKKVIVYELQTSSSGSTDSSSTGTSTDSTSSGTTSGTDSTGSTVVGSVSSGTAATKYKGKKLVTSKARKKGERYMAIVKNGKVTGYIHLSSSESKSIYGGSKLPVKSSLSKMKKGQRYQRVYHNGKLAKLVWVPKNYKGKMHINL